MIVGDSLVVVPGYSILRATARAARSRTSAASTGASRPASTRPDVFNWFDEIRPASPTSSRAS